MRARRRVASPSPNRRTSSLPSSARATWMVGRAKNARGRGVQPTPSGLGSVPASGTARSSIQQQPRSIHPLQQAPEAAVSFQRGQQARGGAPVVLAVDVAGDQTIAQEQEGGLRDVGQAVVAQGFDLACEKK